MKNYLNALVSALLMSAVSICGCNAQCPVGGISNAVLREASTLALVSSSNPLKLDTRYYVDITISPTMSPDLTLVVMTSVSGGLGYKNYDGSPGGIVPFETIPPAGSGLDTGASSTPKVLRFAYWSSPDQYDISNQISYVIRPECSNGFGQPRRRGQSVTLFNPTFY